MFSEQVFSKFSDLQQVRNALAYQKLVGERLVDVALYAPTSVIIRKYIHELSPDIIGQDVILKVKVLSYKNENYGIARTKFPFIITCEIVEDEKKENLSCFVSKPLLKVLFFNVRTMYLKKLFPLEKEITITGKLSFSHKTSSYCISHPEVIPNSALVEHYVKPEPIYPLNMYTKQKVMKRIISEVIRYIYDPQDWIPKRILKERNWPSWKNAILQIHNPKSLDDLTLENPARQRLLFDELLAKQLRMFSKIKVSDQKAPSIPYSEKLESLVENLPFILTKSQKLAIADIQNDMLQNIPMLRLLQGDVGSGKTVVALIAAAQAVFAGYQVAFLAPTDILAKQHYVSACLFFKSNNVTLYTANQKGKEREKILSEIAEGNVEFLVGTHALIQEIVEFRSLGLVIVDEQQRFGVEQRLKLPQKALEGIVPHVLSMSATPIPRTLLLSHLGDMSVSYLAEKPSQRLKIITSAISIHKIDEITNSLKKIIEKKQQIYWVCPLVEESNVFDFTPVVKRFDFLKKIFPGKVAMVHGQLKNEEKQRVMDGFYNGDIAILVATTVIEIGLDSPNATVMVIENAERFGLSQLHQLRGRVGRGVEQSYCILLYCDNVTDLAKKRLQVIKECEDGFKIAELDLLLRGAGDVFGTQQSGLASIKMIPKRKNKQMQNLQTYYEFFADMISLAAKTAKEIIKEGIDYSFLERIFFGDNLKIKKIGEADLRNAG